MELNAIARIAYARGKSVIIAIRANPDLDPLTHPCISTGLGHNKFGIRIGAARALVPRNGTHRAVWDILDA